MKNLDVKKYVTCEFFEPIITGEGPIETANTRCRLTLNCDLTIPIIAAMEDARVAGRLTPIPNLEGRDFPAGKMFNKFVEVGLEALNETGLCFASEILFEHLYMNVVGDFLSKHTESDGKLLDEARFRKDLGPVVKKVNDFLNNPKLHTKENEWPRDTDYTDRDRLLETGEVITYMVQFDGWETKLFARVDGEWWAEVTEPLENSLPTP